MALLDVLGLLFGVSEAASARTQILADVGRFQRSRSYDRNSELTGTFTATTDPTLSTVEGLAEGTAGRLLGKIGPGLPVVTHGLARQVIALHTAILVEVGSEEINEVRLRELRDEANEAYPALIEALKDARDDGDLLATAEDFGEIQILSPSAPPVIWPVVIPPV